MTNSEPGNRPRRSLPRWVYLATGCALVAAAILAWLPVLPMLLAAGNTRPTPAWAWGLLCLPVILAGIVVILVGYYRRRPASGGTAQ